MGVFGHQLKRRQEFMPDDDDDESAIINDDYKLPLNPTPSIKMIKNDENPTSIEQGILKSMGSK